MISRITAMIMYHIKNCVKFVTINRGDIYYINKADEATIWLLNKIKDVIDQSTIKRKKLKVRISLEKYGLHMI